METFGQFSRSQISDTPANTSSEEYRELDKTILRFSGQAVYVYSFSQHRMLYATGWDDLLGYDNQEINMLHLVNITTPDYKRFSNDINDKALLFLGTKTKKLREYSFTLETKKIHKNGEHIPLIWRVNVHTVKEGRVDQIIGIAERINSIKFGSIMQYSAYGPDTSNFEEMLNKELFSYWAISRKEKEALLLASTGLTFKEIADKLGVSVSAIEKRIIPLYKKFRVKSLPHLVSFAHENNIL